MEWLVERLPQLAAAAGAVAGLIGAAWKLRIGPRSERFARWLWGEIRTTIWAKKELIECRRQSQIREATFATTEAENEKLLRRVSTLLEVCGGSDSARLPQLPQQVTTSPDDSPPSPSGTGMQAY